MKREKYRTDIGWGDVEDLARKVEREHQLSVVFEVRFPRGRGDAYLEVVLERLAMAAGRGEVLRVRVPIKMTATTSIYAQLLRATWQALSELERDPWLWEPERRRAARGEG